MTCVDPGIYSVKKSWKLSDLKEYHTAPPYTTVDKSKKARMFRGRKVLCFGFDGGGGTELCGGAACVGEIGEWGVLGTIGGGDVA